MVDLETLTTDKYDIVIDRIDEELKLFPNLPIAEVVNKVFLELDFTVTPDFIYYLLNKTLRFWVDMDEDYYDLATSWVLGTYYFKTWVTYPYIFINAVKRSGKTRLLKLMSVLSNGVYTMSLKQAVLFRLPSIKKCGLFIDEVENISSKEKSDLRELLDTAYKKGGIVYRMRKNPFNEKQVLDEFELFIPVAMANISGVDDVLEDRCLSIILERSNNEKITNLVEYFELDTKIRLFKYLISLNDENLVSLVSLLSLKYQKTIYYTFTKIDTKNTNNTNNTIDTNDTNIGKILAKHITGRDLELWLPLLLVKEIYTGSNDDLIEIANKFVNERKTTDIMEDRDTSMLIFLANFIRGRTTTDFIPYKEICDNYNNEEGIDNKNRFAMNNRTLAKILKRLKVVVEKRRLANSREVVLNFEKIKNKVEKLGIEIKPVDSEDKEVQETL